VVINRRKGGFAAKLAESKLWSELSSYKPERKKKKNIFAKFRKRHVQPAETALKRANDLTDWCGVMPDHKLLESMPCAKTNLDQFYAVPIRKKAPMKLPKPIGLDTFRQQKARIKLEPIEQDLGRSVRHSKSHRKPKMGSSSPAHSTQSRDSRHRQGRGNQAEHDTAALPCTVLAQASKSDTHTHRLNMLVLGKKVP
jgi:hypothetical protein